MGSDPLVPLKAMNLTIEQIAATTGLAAGEIKAL